MIKLLGRKWKNYEFPIILNYNIYEIYEITKNKKFNFNKFKLLSEKF